MKWFSRIGSVSLLLALVACGSSGHANAPVPVRITLSSGGHNVSSSQEAALVVSRGAPVRIAISKTSATVTARIQPLLRPGTSVRSYLEALASGAKIEDPAPRIMRLRGTEVRRLDLAPNYYELDAGGARVAFAIVPGAWPQVVKLPLLVGGTCQIVALRPVPVPAFVVANVRRMLDGLGDRHPDSARYVLTTELLADAGTQGGVVAHSCNQPVYLVVLTGHFVANDVPRPPGAASPHGTVATATYPVDGGEGGGFGLSSRSYDLSRLGRVGDLRPYLNGKGSTSKPVVVASVPKP